jgi:hypothetical protein
VFRLGLLLSFLLPGYTDAIFRQFKARSIDRSERVKSGHWWSANVRYPLFSSCCDHKTILYKLLTGKSPYNQVRRRRSCSPRSLSAIPVRTRRQRMQSASGLRRQGSNAGSLHANIEVGSDWTKGIMQGIAGCRALILVFSAHANDSDHVHREVAKAFSSGLAVILFRIEEVMPPAVWLIF